MMSVDAYASAVAGLEDQSDARLGTRFLVSRVGCQCLFGILYQRLRIKMFVYKGAQYDFTGIQPD